MGRLISDSEFDVVNTSVTVYKSVPLDYYIYFDVEYDDPSICLALSKYQISVVGRSTLFKANILECGGFGDYMLTYDHTNDKLYLGLCSNPGECGTSLPTNYEVHSSSNKSCLELYLTLSSQNNHPYLTWNPYHDQENVVYYKIYKKKNSANFELLNTTTDTYYEDISEQIYSAPSQKTYAYYKISAYLAGNIESLEGNTERSAINDIIEEQKIMIDEKDSLSQLLFAFSNYPNPFNPSTVISYTIDSDSYVTLKVFDLLGREMVMLADEFKRAGSYEAAFNGADLPSGIYICTLNINGKTFSKKMQLLK